MEMVYDHQRFGEERALYGQKNIKIDHCQFAGAEDGESALKECQDVHILNTDFELRYPLWHVTHGYLDQCHMSETCRAALWYDKDIEIKDCEMNGIKALRECSNIKISDTKIHSLEFGWFCKDVQMNDCDLNSEYPFMKSKRMTFDHFKMKAKYSFQYTKEITIKNSELDTKDAFWHSKNVTVYDSVIKGEYLGWYSKHLKLVRCKIIGTQPFCYCDDLVLEDCEMIDCDLSFEKSSVHATIKGSIMSVKNPKSGIIEADQIEKIIMDETAKNSTCDIRILKTV